MKTWSEHHATNKHYSEVP